MTQPVLTQPVLTSSMGSDTTRSPPESCRQHSDAGHPSDAQRSADSRRPSVTAAVERSGAATPAVSLAARTSAWVAAIAPVGSPIRPRARAVRNIASASVVPVRPP